MTKSRFLIKKCANYHQKTCLFIVGEHQCILYGDLKWFGFLVVAAEYTPAPWPPTLLNWVGVRAWGELVVAQPLLGPSGRLRGMGNFGCEATPWVKLLGNKFRFRVFGRISGFWKSQHPALAGTGFGAQLFLMSNLRQICFSVTFVSSALEAWLPWEFELKVSSYGFCFNRQPIVSVHLSIDSCVGLVTTWLILPVVICLSQRLSHACLSISFCTAKLRMAH